MIREIIPRKLMVMSCEDCPFYAYDYKGGDRSRLCLTSDRVIQDPKDIPDWCKLDYYEDRT